MNKITVTGKKAYSSPWFTLFRVVEFVAGLTMLYGGMEGLNKHGCLEWGFLWVAWQFFLSLYCFYQVFRMGPKQQAQKEIGQGILDAIAMCEITNLLDPACDRHSHLDSDKRKFLAESLVIATRSKEVLEHFTETKEKHPWPEQ